MKILLTILAFFASTSLVFGATNLWQFYDEQGLLLPSFEYRKDFYEQILNDDVYKGTAEQNDLYLQYLQENEFVKSPKQEEIKLGAFNPAGGTTYRLQTSIGTTDTTVKLSSFKNRSSIALTMTLLNTDIGYGTLSPQTSRSEFVSFSGITQNSDGTATLTGVTRGLSDISPFTASTTLRQAHAGQSVFILSDSPQLFEEYAKRRNDETIAGLWNFNSYLPTSSITATTSAQFTTKGYVDNVTNAGAATSTETNGGIVELGTLAEQADSYDGGANKPTVLQTKNSTSTCQVVGSYNIVASSTSGKLDKNCLDQTLNYSWSGTNTFSGTSLNTASTTFTATTTILASSATNNALTLNGINYAFPSTQGASSTALTTDGNGNLIWGNPTPVRYSYATNTPMSVTGSSVTSSFFTIPAGVMRASSTIIVDAQISKCLAPGGSGANCSITIQDGAATAFGSAVVGFTTDVSVDSKLGTLHAVIFNNSSVSSQSGIITSFCVDPTVSATANSGCAGGVISSTINTAAAITIAIKLTANAGTVTILDRYSIVVEQ